MASSILGEPRATADVDLVADLCGRHVSALVTALIETYYIDEDATMAAVMVRGAFNVIQLASMTKVDIYCSADEPLAREELQRRIFIDADGQRLPCATAEDIILQKLNGSSQAVGCRIGHGAMSGVLSGCKVRRATANIWSATRPGSVCSLCAYAR